ncbi:MAG: hypothetical protein NVS4B12_14990 [Ktedonobacteraceae bacterium]
MLNGKKIVEHIDHTANSTTLTVVQKEDNRDTPLLTEVEQQQLATWNATRQKYPTDVCIPQLVAMQAAATPAATALVMADHVLSYGELNRRANQLAHYLLTQGVGPNVLVGLYIERSLDMVIGLLGILKAGGAYVPLDAAYPSERLSFMLEDAHTSIVVTKKQLAPRLSTQDIRVVCLDDDVAILAQQSEAEPTHSLHPSDLAYVIYTSGSTGLPKGVQITHSSLLNLVFWHQQAFTVTASDRATQVASPAFDATGWELWPYLVTGASIYLPDEDTRIDPVKLRDWLVDNRITISFLPTALAEGVLVLEWPTPGSLRFLLTGADALHHYPASALPFAFINNYGPTEATVVTTSGRVLPVEHADGPPSIGRPIANTQVYILDEQLRQVPIGEVGELYIGGAGLAKGYLNRPELTAEKFIPHPFSSEPGAQLYKTGDLVRYLVDGQIAFVGRTDHQVKIRGYRIETNEIVSVLNRHSSIRASVVVAQEDAPGSKHLVAYIVLVPDESMSVASLRETLATRLPDYMIPTIFVVLESLPQTPNGKVDRNALPTPDETNILQDEIIALPTTPLEERLVEIVAPLLGLTQVSIDDNFFMIGGHSLLGTQVIMRIAETFGVELTLRSLFNAPTIRELAVEVEQLIFAKIEAMSDDEVQQLLA